MGGGGEAAEALTYQGVSEKESPHCLQVQLLYSKGHLQGSTHSSGTTER